MAQDGIGVVIGDKYGKGLGRSQKYNFAPRLGFAYQVTPKLVARGGFGLFYNGFENRGFSPNLGENYPFQFNFQYSASDDGHPIAFPGCAPAATFEVGFSCTPLDPTLVNASGLALRGIQFDYQTPYSMSGNLTLQYQITPTFSLQIGYVTSLARHLESFPGSNRPTQILPVDTTLSRWHSPPVPASQGGLPFPDFGQNASYAITSGNSHYHSLQTKAEKQFSNGLSFLATYTWSQARTDAGDLLNGGSTAGFRAPDVPGAGIAVRLRPGIVRYSQRRTPERQLRASFRQEQTLHGERQQDYEHPARRLDRELGCGLARRTTDNPQLSFWHRQRYGMLRHPDPGARSKERDAHRLQRTAQLPREPGGMDPALRVAVNWTRPHFGCGMHSD